MKNNTNHNSDFECGFAETLVAVLYDEATAAEADDFARHLDLCNHCGEELKTFGMLRSTVADWRESEFAKLASPIIVLPSETEPGGFHADKKNSTLEWLRGLLSPIHFGWQAAAAFSALAIFAFLGFVLTVNRHNSPQDFSVEAPAVSSLPATSPLASNAKRKEISAGDTISANGNRAIVQTAPLQKSNSDARANGKTIKTGARTTIGNSPKRRVLTRQPATVEDLNVLSAETEDNSLRLTELLDEIEPSA